MTARTGMLHVLLLLLMLAGGCHATQPQPQPPAKPQHKCENDVCCVSLIQDLEAAGLALTTVDIIPRTFDCHETTPATEPTPLKPDEQFGMCKIEVSLVVDTTGAITGIDEDATVEKGSETRQCKDATGKIAFDAADKCTLDVANKKVTCHCLGHVCNTEDLVLDYLTAHREIDNEADKLAAFKFKPVSLSGKSRSHPLEACIKLGPSESVVDQCCRDNFNKHIARLVKHNEGYAWTKNDNLKDVVEMGADGKPDASKLKLKFKCHEKTNVDGTGAATTLAAARGTPVDKEVVVIDKPAMCVTKVKLEKDGEKLRIKAEYMDYAQDNADCKNGDVNATSTIYPLTYAQEAGCVITTSPLSLVCYCHAMANKACNEHGHKDIVDFVVDTDDDRFSEYKAGSPLQIFGYRGTVVSFEDEQKLQTSPTYHRAYLYSNKLDKPSFVTKDPFNNDVAVNKFKHDTYMKLLPGSIIEYSANKKDTPTPDDLNCMVNLKNVDRCNRIYFCKINKDDEYGEDNTKKMRTRRNFCSGDYMVLKVKDTNVDEHKIGTSFTWDANEKKITMKAKHLDRIVIYSPEPECTLSAIMSDGDCYEHSVPNVLRSSMVASGSPPVYPMHMRWVAHSQFDIDKFYEKQQLSKIFPYTRSTDKKPSYKCFASRGDNGKSCRQAKQVVMKLPNRNVPFAVTLRVNEKCDWVSMCIYVRTGSSPNSKAGEALLSQDPISQANMEHLVSCKIDAVTEVSLANHYVMFPNTNLPVRLPLTKDFYGNHYALTFQRSKTNYISVASNGVAAKSSLRLQFADRIMFEFPRDDCLLGMADDTHEGYVLTQGIALHANTQSPDKLAEDEVANVDTNVGGATNMGDEIVTLPPVTEPSTALVPIISVSEKLYVKADPTQAAFSINKRNNDQDDAYLLWSGFIGLITGMVIGLLIASMFGFICRRSLYKDWYRSMYSRYGSSATTATPTGAGETGMTSAQTGMSMMGGTTTGSTMGGTTAGGTTAGESSTMGGTTVG